ncbi:hypothetical protein V8E36_006186 [Tilletia maclaganii]
MLRTGCLYDLQTRCELDLTASPFVTALVLRRSNLTASPFTISLLTAHRFPAHVSFVDLPHENTGWLHSSFHTAHSRYSEDQVRATFVPSNPLIARLASSLTTYRSSRSPTFSGKTACLPTPSSILIQPTQYPPFSEVQRPLDRHHGTGPTGLRRETILVPTFERHRPSREGQRRSLAQRSRPRISPGDKGLISHIATSLLPSILNTQSTPPCPQCPR